MVLTSREALVKKSNSNHALRQSEKFRIYNNQGLIESEIEIQKIFNGNYWDEFSLPLFFSDSIRDVLFLGIGIGSGLRPMHHFNPKLTFKCVDYDEQKGNQFQKLFNKYFSDIKYTFYNEKASDYLSSASEHQEQFDIIWIDIFDNSGPSPDLLQSTFWQNINNLCKENSIIAINLYGIPSHLLYYHSNILNPKALEPFMGILNNVDNFCYRTIIPHRNNSTLLLSKKKLEAVINSDIINCPNIKLQYLRCHNPLEYKLNDQSFAKNIEGKPIKRDFNLFSFEQTSDLAKHLWHEFFVISGLNAEFNLEPSKFRNFVQNSENWNYIGSNLTIALALPVLMASDHHREDKFDNSNWANYILKNYDQIKLMLPENIFYHFVLQNAWAIALSLPESNSIKMGLKNRILGELL
jgi:hypothetical protein